MGLRQAAETSERNHEMMSQQFSPSFRPLVPPIRSSYTACRKLVEELQIESGTRTINLPVPLCFRSSCQRLQPGLTNSGSGALAEYIATSSLANADSLLRCPKRQRRARQSLLLLLIR